MVGLAVITAIHSIGYDQHLLFLLFLWKYNQLSVVYISDLFTLTPQGSFNGTGQLYDIHSAS